jgi:penicillin-binding protein 2
MAAAALNEKVVQPDTTFLSTGALRLENPYQPGVYSVFRDWRAHGLVDLQRALAVSSDEYFYIVGGGFGSQEGLGITRIDTYMQRFGFGLPTGINLGNEAAGTVPSPDWKAETFPNDPEWRIGDTYHTSIGQYGFQVTPVQAVRAVASIANGGLLLTPRIDTTYARYGARSIDVPDDYLRIIRGGMRDGVANGGTAAGLNTPYVAVAGKTGTAELGVKKDFENSWVTGFFPYDNPRYAFAVVMEHGPIGNLYGATYVMRQLLDWMHGNTPEYLSDE